jgi:hypothetical protein
VLVLALGFAGIVPVTGPAPVAAMRFGENITPGRGIWFLAKPGEHYHAKRKARQQLHQATAGGRGGHGFCKAVKRPGIHSQFPLGDVLRALAPNVESDVVHGPPSLGYVSSDIHRSVVQIVHKRPRQATRRWSHVFCALQSRSVSRARSSRARCSG